MQDKTSIGSSLLFGGITEIRNAVHEELDIAIHFSNNKVGVEAVAGSLLHLFHGRRPHLKAASRLLLRRGIHCLPAVCARLGPGEVHLIPDMEGPDAVGIAAAGDAGHAGGAHPSEAASGRELLLAAGELAALLCSFGLGEAPCRAQVLRALCRAPGSIRGSEEELRDSPVCVGVVSGLEVRH